MKNLLVALLFFIFTGLNAQEYYSLNDQVLRLSNGSLTREISFLHDSVTGRSLTIPGQGEEFLRRSREFSFRVNGKTLDGYSGWKMVKAENASDGRYGRGVTVTLDSKDKTLPLRITLNYLLYPNVNVIRKWIGFINTGNEDIRLEALNVEDLATVLSQVSSVVYHNYGRMKHLGTYIGNWDDPVLIVHDITHQRGLAVGNEAPGITKRTAWNTRADNLEAGLTHPGQDYPFRKWLKPGETWESPKTFLCAYNGTDDGFSVVNNELNAFIVKYLRPRIIEDEKKPVFVYNTWNPFRTFVNDSLVREVARAAAGCGIQEFIIDDGWQVNDGSASSKEAWGNNYGDWLVDTVKFPGGLKPTFDYIRSLGMKPGLWISIGAATADSKVYREHPDWFVKNVNGEPGNIHSLHDEDFYSSCFGTDWFNYIKSVVLRLVDEYGLAYAKLDFSVVTSAYVTNKNISGCYATDHPYHRDHEESFIIIYERILRLFDELHDEAPDLFIDCTFETAGKLQLMDYAIAEHADGNWLANFEEPSPLGPLRIRQMSWWRSPALPASSLVIGNSQMNDPGFELALKSLAGSLPIVLGDPRKIPAEKRQRIKRWSDWMKSMQKKYDYMSYRKDLPGFGEPREGAWDGWMRINFQTKEGGIFGVFRQNAREESRVVFLTDIKPDKTYTIRLAPDGNEVYEATGIELMEAGFPVKIPENCGGRIYEIRMK
ncbi:MAG TPA: alpha-galactosidase [Bacteroidales bacterium]|nr:alpha-galactosidase [Bacteroidales bacterium]